MTKVARRILIIGGGPAGLAAGIYCRMAGASSRSCSRRTPLLTVIHFSLACRRHLTGHIRSDMNMFIQ